MTQLNRKLPLGIQDFEEMRRDHYIYADKTDKYKEILKASTAKI